MSGNKLLKSILISFLYAVLCTISASVNWYFQFATVIVLGVAVLFYTFSFISAKWYINLFVLLPFYIIYIPASLYFKSYYTYPIWMFGILISFLAYILLYKKKSFFFYALICVSVLTMILIFFFPNYYSFLNAQKYLNNYVLDKFDIYDFGGKKIPLNNFRRKVVLFDIWHTSCAPCIENFPKLENLLLRFGSDTNVIIAVLNIPIERENDRSLANQYTEKYNFKKYYFKNYAVANAIGIKTVPFVLIFDGNNKCKYAGSLNYGNNIFIGNVEKMIGNLQIKYNSRE